MISVGNAYPFYRNAALMAAFFFVLIGFFKYFSKLEIDKFDGQTMGTSWSVIIVDPVASHDRVAVQKEIESVLAGLNREMSTYDSTSDISIFNQSSDLNGWFAVSDRFANATAKALSFSEISEGAFDPTVGPLVNLWGFGPEDGVVVLPSDMQVNDTKARVGFEAIRVRTLESDGGAALLKSAQRQLDLSAIAKGLGVDEVFRFLEAQGYSNYLVEIGGEVRVKGTKGGLGWRVAIEKPTREARLVEEVLELSNIALATSGDYRNYREINGVAYSHIIDPSTGWPVTHQLASVTVASPDCVTADAWATTLLVLGPEAGYAMAKERYLAALFIERTADGFMIKQTPEFESLQVGDME